MVKKGDFVRIEYTGYDDAGNVFDSTSGEIAKEIHGKEGSMLIVFGFDYIVPGMADAITAMKKGEQKEFTLSPEKAFGSRDPSRLKVFSLSEFHRKEIDPYPGAIIQLETEFGTLNGLVKSVNSGRVLMDFNHPLADKNIRYNLKLCDVFESPAEKVSELVKDLDIQGTASLLGEKAVVLMKKGQPDAQVKKTRLTVAVKSTIPEIKDLEINEAEGNS
ncbi:MAG: peptidylprolyl isomerase [Candidatus Micrarchaeia archaeon]